MVSKCKLHKAVRMEAYLQMKFACGQDNVFSGLLLERLYGWICLTENFKAVDQLRKIDLEFMLEMHTLR